MVDSWYSGYVLHTSRPHYTVAGCLVCVPPATVIVSRVRVPVEHEERCSRRSRSSPRGEAAYAAVLC